MKNEELIEILLNKNYDKILTFKNNSENNLN